MALLTRPLGSTGFEITTVGFGSWAVGGGGWSFGWGPQDDDASAAAITHAVELGITWVDTAAVYGHGHGEEVVGRAVRALPAVSRPLVFTKCGLVWDDADPMKPASRVVTAETVRRGAEDSLRRLGLSRIDLFQIHWPDAENRPIEPAWREMLKLRDEGCALLVVSEELEELFEISDRLLVIAQGRVSPSVLVAEATVAMIGERMSGLWDAGSAGMSGVGHAQT